MVGYFAVSTKEEGKGWDVKLGALMWALEKGMYVAGFLFIALTALLIWILFDSKHGWKIYGCILIGLVAGAAIGKGRSTGVSSLALLRVPPSAKSPSTSHLSTSAP